MYATISDGKGLFFFIIEWKPEVTDVCDSHNFSFSLQVPDKAEAKV